MVLLQIDKRNSGSKKSLKDSIKKKSQKTKTKYPKQKYDDQWEEYTKTDPKEHDERKRNIVKKGKIIFMQKNM